MLRRRLGVIRFVFLVFLLPYEMVREVLMVGGRISWILPRRKRAFMRSVDMRRQGRRCIISLMGRRRNGGFEGLEGSREFDHFIIEFR
jgi:hypothetical protein